MNIVSDFDIRLPAGEAGISDLRLKIFLEMGFNVGVIIVCAGRGKRLGYKDKAFLKLAGIPLFLHAFKAFRTFKQIKQIVFVFRPDSIDKVGAKILSSMDSRVVFVKGGKYRKDSVFCGLKVLAKDTNFVLIHDVARPLISQKIIHAVLTGLKKYPAIIPGILAQDTVRTVNKDFVTKTLDRNTILLTQTPQGFKKDLLLKAYEKHISQKLTDDAQFLELLGEKVKIIEGSRHNIKITYPEDLKLAEALLK